MNLLAHEHIPFGIYDEFVYLILISAILLWCTQIVVTIRGRKEAEKSRDARFLVIVFSFVYFLGASFLLSHSMFEDVMNHSTVTEILKEELRSAYSPNPLLWSTWGYAILIAAVGPFVQIIITISNQAFQSTRISRSD